MKLSEHVEHIRQLIDQAFRNRLGRMGINEGQLTAIENMPAERKRMETIREVFIAETGTVADAYEKLVEELTFTLFNRLAALKVMEAHTLHPEIVTRRESHGGRSFAHLAWLEQNPNARNEEAEGLLLFLEDQLQKLASDIPLFSPQHPYHLLPTALELQGIINAFNQVETDTQVETEIWKSDDVLGWLYESYNNYKKAAHKASGDKTEYNKVSIQSQVYTPRWVVQFLVDNSLGKLYLEMYPDSEIRNKYKIANAPTSHTRERKPLHEIKMIDPSTGSGNYLLYGFDMYYDLYIDQIENYGADYNEADVPKLIIENNLHGVDLDDRAIQLAQLGLYIKAKRKKRTAKIEHFNIVSSDFFLPDYNEIWDWFGPELRQDKELDQLMNQIWVDLQNAHKFGSLLRIEERFNAKLDEIENRFKQPQLNLLEEPNMSYLVDLRSRYINILKGAVEEKARKTGVTFLSTKTQDAITFLQLLTQKYDVAVANPPYTDSADFGPELKIFVEANYKQPYKFNTNLYAVFIKRCCEIINENGKVAMVHPPTFMYIKTFEDVRKFIVNKMHISLFVEWGYLGMFHQSARVDAAMYILEKEPKDVPVQFIKLNDIYEGRRYEAFVKAYEDLLANRPNKHNITLPQEKLKIIEGWPFIYWISDGFRAKFKGERLNDKIKVCSGLSTANNDRFLRFWWEVGYENIYQGIVEDKRKWVLYCKGGPYKKWSGNLWVVVNYQNDGSLLRDNGGTLRNKDFYFKEGITCSGRSSSKGVSYRYFPSNHIFDVGATGLIPINENSLWYGLGFMNSKLTTYILDCLNPTVNTTEGDLQKVPFIVPADDLSVKVELLTKSNTEISFSLLKFRSIETSFEQSPFTAFVGASLKDRVLAYLNYENIQHTQVLINEAIINELIFEVYELSDADREQVETKMGLSIGSFAVLKEAKESFLAQLQNPITEVTDHIQNLAITTFDEQQTREIKEDFVTLYQSNNDLEEFCNRHQVNPINVWYWFKEANTLPVARASEIALEFLADAIRTLLQQDEDGIIPLVGLPGEEALSQRLEQHCLQNGFTAAQYMQLDSLLGRSVNEYLEHHFFNQLSNHLNLFMYLPKTPFIWHLSSGQHQGFEAYILIYKWNRDSLFKLKSHYITHRVQNLEYRQITLQDVNTAQAQTEKETIRLQLQEIKLFTTKIDELIAEGYDPKLDDGVGKNIAPLQKKDLLRAEVLKANQLTKYLNADW